MQHIWFSLTHTYHTISTGVVATIAENTTRVHTLLASCLSVVTCYGQLICCVNVNMIVSVAIKEKVHTANYSLNLWSRMKHWHNWLKLVLFRLAVVIL